MSGKVATLPIDLEKPRIWQFKAKKYLEFSKYLNALKLKYKRSSVFINNCYSTQFYLNHFCPLQLMIYCI